MIYALLLTQNLGNALKIANTVDNIDKFDYESDILFGINSISLKISDREIDKYIIFGVNRVVSFDGKMIEKIYSSSSSIDTFSNIVKEIQYLDAYSAYQNFYKNNDDGKIMGGYALPEYHFSSISSVKLHL